MDNAAYMSQGRDLGLKKIAGQSCKLQHSFCFTPGMSKWVYSLTRRVKTVENNRK